MDRERRKLKMRYGARSKVIAKIYYLDGLFVYQRRQLIYEPFTSISIMIVPFLGCRVKLRDERGSVHEFGRVGQGYKFAPYHQRYFHLDVVGTTA